jgi:hypothetical protein
VGLERVVAAHVHPVVDDGLVVRHRGQLHALAPMDTFYSVSEPGPVPRRAADRRGNERTTA